MNNITLLLLGAFTAILGGYIGDEIRSWRERSRECSSIKISIFDELQEIEATISSMHEVWVNAKLFHPSYIETLLASTSAYDHLRTRIFLIKDDELRRNIRDFYKKLKDQAHKTEGKIGLLSPDTEATKAQAEFDSAFQSLAADSKKIRERL